MTVTNTNHNHHSMDPTHITTNYNNNNNNNENGTFPSHDNNKKDMSSSSTSTTTTTSRRSKTMNTTTSNGHDIIYPVYKPTKTIKQLKYKWKTNKNKNTSYFVSLLLFICNIIRIILIDLPLVLLFIILLGIYTIQNIYTIYYIPLISRVQRTNIHLLNEYTYYDRQCTEYDISTTNINDLILSIDDDNNNNDIDTTTNTDHIVQKATKQMLQHGAIIIPNLLSYNTTQLLRQYIVYKNKHITENEKYPVSQGYKRLSYGIDASEHITVSNAIHEIIYGTTGTNTKRNRTSYIRPILQHILGDIDPANVEITAIMNYYGAYHQVWHQDTKQDGNAIKFARTYSHSYSLFIPLQDISYNMGPTDICPGTQYCTNDLEYTCEQNKISLHLISNTTTNNNNNTNNTNNESSVFPAGYGALLNQHIWHRGGAHNDPNALERIVFILSFVARPKHDIYNIDDTRQLSRGTYFHQKWNMWGHTMNDFSNPIQYMKYPYSILRSLSIYKYSHMKANWGYDLLTATYMRFANEQLESTDLNERFIPRLIQLHFPTFLLGRVLYDDDESVTQLKAWTTFIQETIQNIYEYSLWMNINIHSLYIGILFVLACIISLYKRSINSFYSIFIRNGMQRIFYTHIFVLLLCYYIWYYMIYTSNWSQNVLSGRLLQRPFPTIQYQNSIESFSYHIPHDSNTTTTLYIPLHIQNTIPFQKCYKTTIPTRYDILFGTRYDAEFLGSYNQWLHYHPGNFIYNEIIDTYRPLFHEYFNNYNSFLLLHDSNIIIQQIIKDLYQKSLGQVRFLQQNWYTGDWHIINDPNDIESIIFSDLILSHHNPIRRYMNYRIAYHRFGPYRNTSMSKLSHLQLYKLRQQLLRIDDTTPVCGTISSSSNNNAETTFNKNVISSSCCKIKQYNTGATMLRTNQRRYETFVSSWNRRKQFITPSDQDNITNVSDMLNQHSNNDNIQVGTLIWYNYIDSEDWIPGIVMKINDANDDDDNDINTYYDIALDDGSRYKNVPIDQIHIYRSVTEGDIVYGCFDSNLQDCYSGTILHVYPSGTIRILYDDDDIYDHVPSNMYYVPPYRYDGPTQGS